MLFCLSVYGSCKENMHEQNSYHFDVSHIGRLCH